MDREKGDETAVPRDFLLKTFAVARVVDPGYRLRWRFGFGSGQSLVNPFGEAREKLAWRRHRLIVEMIPGIWIQIVDTFDSR